LLRGKATGLGLPSYDAPASVTSIRRMAAADEIACGRFELAPLHLARPSHHQNLVLLQPCPRH